MLSLPWFSVNETIFLAGQANSWCINDWHHELNILCDDTVEELLITILKANDVDVSIEIIVPPIEVLHDNVDLLILSEY